MRLATRLRTLEARVLLDDAVPGLLIVFEEVDGVWHDGRGTPIDRGAIDPRTSVIVFEQRPDGPD